MSEQKKSFMEELDDWVEQNVINPLHEAVTEGDNASCDATCEGIKKAIRAKVLESYRNGQKKPVVAEPVRATTQKGARKWK